MDSGSNASPDDETRALSGVNFMPEISHVVSIIEGAFGQVQCSTVLSFMAFCGSALIAFPYSPSRGGRFQYMALWTEQ